MKKLWIAGCIALLVAAVAFAATGIKTLQVVSDYAAPMLPPPFPGVTPELLEGEHIDGSDSHDN